MHYKLYYHYSMKLKRWVYISCLNEKAKCYIYLFFLHSKKFWRWIMFLKAICWNSIFQYHHYENYYGYICYWVWIGKIGEKQSISFVFRNPRLNNMCASQKLTFYIGFSLEKNKVISKITAHLSLGSSFGPGGDLKIPSQI